MDRQDKQDFLPSAPLDSFLTGRTRISRQQNPVYPVNPCKSEKGGAAVDVQGLAGDKADMTTLINAGRWEGANMAAHYTREVRSGEVAVTQFYQHHGNRLV